MTAGHAPRLDALAIAGATLAVYISIAPRILYGPDAFTFFQMAQQGNAVHWMHVLYVPILRLAGWLGGTLHVDPLAAFAGASAVGSAIGVFFCHRAAALLGSSRAQAALCAALVATTPGVVFFGAVLEVQGVFFGFAALAWWTGARFVRAASTARVIEIGLATGTAALVHSSGQLLTVAVASIALSRLPRGTLTLSKAIRFGVVGSLAHLAPAAILHLVAKIDVFQSLSNSANFVSNSSTGAGGLEHLWAIFRTEWLYSFAPLCVLVYFAARRRELRATLVAMHVPFATYLFVSWALLGYTFGVHGIEHGAYFLPLAFPLAWLSAHALPGWAAIACVVVGLAVGLAHLHHESGPRDSSFDPVAVVDALGSDQGVLIVRSAKEGEALAIAKPGLALVPFDVLVGGAPRSFDEIVADLGAQLDGLHAANRPVAFAASVYDPLLAVDDLLPRWLTERYRVESRASGDFRC
ncbi:MAG: hypothetical protein AB7T19_12265, partial [Planctomycetota bacterium]